jgi:hypothetical protein
MLNDRLPDGYAGTPRRNVPDWDKIISLAHSSGFASLLPAIDKQRQASIQPEFLF